MGVRLLPQIGFKAHFFQFLQKSLGVRETGTVPDVSAGIGMSLPARLQPEDVAGHAVLPDLPRQRQQRLLVGVPVRPVEDAQPPQRRQGAAAAEQVIPADSVTEIFSGEDVQVHSFRSRDIDQHIA